MSKEPSARDLFLAALGDHIREWRRALELSQATVAQRAGLAISTVRRIEAGKVDLRVTMFLALANAMEAELYELADVGGHELGVAADASLKARKR